MINDLRNSIIFLHGLSGSGKGEIQRKLSERYSSDGYAVTYVSSGALFRAALADPIIAEQVRRGYFLDTLGAIMPGIENAFDHFVKQWAESDGKAVIILDGLIRRGSFTNREGVQIPSQVEQLAVGLGNVLEHLAVEEDGEFSQHFPEYLEGKPKEEIDEILKETLRDSTHIVADVLPEDAEAQMKRRADKEIASIRTQLVDKVANGQLSDDKMQEIDEHIAKLEAVLHGGIRQEGDSIVYIPRVDWNDEMDPSLYTRAADEVRKTREALAQNMGMESSVGLASSFESIGIFTELRDDDISPIGRKTRIDNYIKEETREGQRVFEPGFATQALSEEMGFRLTSEGSFASDSSNCITVTNGQSRGINLAQFQTKCEFLASRLYNQTEGKRELIFNGKEGQGINREREF